MKILVTGAGGFIGSNISIELLNQGYEVVGVDSLNGLLYSPEIKASRIAHLVQHSNFRFDRLDLAMEDINQIPDEFDGIINEAALPGQILSWNSFDDYVEHNLTSVERLIRFSLTRGIPRFVQASTSSVYGLRAIGTEAQELKPASPYGVTKLAAENLLHAYGQNFPLDFSIVRYFSVYGPHQRPDMGIYKFVSSISSGTPVTIYGDGSQRRDCTYVSDIVSGTIAAIAQGRNGETYNLAGQSDVSVLEIVESCGQIIGRDPIIEFINRPIGDQLFTAADISKATKELSYVPKFTFRQGLEAQIDWQLS